MMSRPFLQMLIPGPTSGSLRDADQRGRFKTGAPFSPAVVQRLPTDAVGTVNLSITGIRPGSEVHIISAENTAIASNENVSGRVTFKLDRYAAGSANNAVRILVAHLQYEHIDLYYELPATDASIPVAQRIDRNYRNPA